MGEADIGKELEGQKKLGRQEVGAGAGRNRGAGRQATERSPGKADKWLVVRTRRERG